MTRLGSVAFVTAGLFATATALAQVNLRQDYQRTDEYVVETVNVIEQTLEIAGMRVETSAEQTARTRYRQGQRDGEGNSLVKLTMESLKAVMELAPGMSVNFDSEAGENKTDNPLLAPIVESLEAVSKLDLKYTISPEGKVLGVEGVEKALEAVSPQTRQLLQQQIDAEAVKLELQQEIDALPNRAVKEGEFWERTVIAPVGQGQVLTFGRRYEYAGTVKREGKVLHKVDLTDTEINFSIEADSTLPITVKESDLKIESSQGEILIDPELGRDVSTRMKTRIVGSIVFEAGGQELPAHLDLTIEVRSTEIK